MQLRKMPSESKPLLTAQTEKPNHYSYLKEFRVEQCPLFLQHKCTQHRPFTCFHWHFMNQRRRRPVRKRDGSFNYSADNYCTKYDETTGLCPEGDDCPFLHRTAGDTERRYHLRYYKTCMCVHDTDSRGFCVKNGPHCAFAHGNHDLRPPVYDIKEIQALENPDGDANASSNGPNVLDKERNLMNEDPKWQDTNYVLSSYKTEPCKRPPRLCRQGYACPQYHNSRDKRRSPRKYKYRSTPCPNVKHGDEWGEPGNCETGDLCGYCHTRTEQQFHPEIYKSTKCNDVQQAGYCPRGVFCAFAHVDQEMSIARELAAPLDIGTNLADILSSALPPHKRDQKSSESSNGSGEMSECASTSSVGSNSSHSKAPGAQLSHNRTDNQISSSYGQQTSQHETIQSLLQLDSDQLDSDKASQKQRLFVTLNLANQQHQQSHQLNNHSSSLITMSPLANHYTYASCDTIESVVGNALDDLHLDEPLNLVAAIDRDFETDSPTISNSISAGLASSGESFTDHWVGPGDCPHAETVVLQQPEFSTGSRHPRSSRTVSSILDDMPFEEEEITRILGSSAPVNIPGSGHNSLGSFSPTASSPLHHLHSGFLSRFSHQDPLDSSSAFMNHVSTSHLAQQLSSSASKLGSFQGSSSSALYDFNMSPSSRAPHPLSHSPLVPTANSAMSEVQRLREELAGNRTKLASWEDKMSQARGACEAWQREVEEANRKANIAEQQRDEAVNQAKALQQEVDLLQGSPYLHGLRRISELRNLSLATLKSLQSQLRSDLEEIDKVLYLQTATKCMVCEERNRTVTLGPCNHYVLCGTCAPNQKDCPYCQTPIIAHSTTTISNSLQT